MKKLLLLAFVFSAIAVSAQDLTGRWEGEFVTGTIGTRQPAKMILDLVQIEDRLYGILELYPVDTRQTDAPNVIFTIDGEWRHGSPRITLILGRPLEGNGGPDFAKFIFGHQSTDFGETLEGKWFRDHESINTRERGAGTFKVVRAGSVISERLNGRKKEKEILEKLKVKS